MNEQLFRAVLVIITMFLVGGLLDLFASYVRHHKLRSWSEFVARGVRVFTVGAIVYALVALFYRLIGLI